MTRSRIPSVLFQPSRHSFPVRLIRATVLGRILIDGLVKIATRPARRVATILIILLSCLLSGIWAFQAIALAAFIGLGLWGICVLDEMGAV